MPIRNFWTLSAFMFRGISELIWLVILSVFFGIIGRYWALWFWNFLWSDQRRVYETLWSILGSVFFTTSSTSTLETFDKLLFNFLFNRILLVFYWSVPSNLIFIFYLVLILLSWCLDNSEYLFRTDDVSMLRHILWVMFRLTFDFGVLCIFIRNILFERFPFCNILDWFFLGCSNFFLNEFCFSSHFFLWLFCLFCFFSVNFFLFMIAESTNTVHFFRARHPYSLNLILQSFVFLFKLLY